MRSVISFFYPLNNLFKKNNKNKGLAKEIKSTDKTLEIIYTLHLPTFFLSPNHHKMSELINQPTTVQDTLGINVEKYLLKSTQLANNRTQSKMTSISPMTTLQSSSIFRST